MNLTNSTQNWTNLFPSRTSGEQYSKVPQKVLKSFPGSIKAALPKSINFKWKFRSMIMFSPECEHGVSMATCCHDTLQSSASALPLPPSSLPLFPSLPSSLPLSLPPSLPLSLPLSLSLSPSPLLSLSHLDISVQNVFTMQV